MSDVQVWIDHAAAQRIDELERDNRLLTHTLNDTQYRLTKAMHRAGWLEAELRRVQAMNDIGEEL